MIESGIIPVIKTIMSWIAIPVTALIGFMGFHYKKMVVAIENLRLENEKLRTHIALNELQLDNLHEDLRELKSDIKELSRKLDRVK